MTNIESGIVLTAVLIGLAVLALGPWTRRPTWQSRALAGGWFGLALCSLPFGGGALLPATWRLGLWFLLSLASLALLRRRPPHPVSGIQGS